LNELDKVRKPQSLTVVSEMVPAVLGRAKTLLNVPRMLATIAPGWVQYLATGKTPDRAYQSMRRLFYLTDGRFNDAVHEVVRRLRPPVALDRTAGVLGDMQGARLEGVLRALDEDGFYVFDERLADSDVQEVVDFALRTPCTPRGENVVREPVLFDASEQRSPVLDFSAADLLTCAPLSRLVADRSILALAQAFLRSSVVLDVPTMWWSTPGSGQASSAAAQLFHVDLDRLRFLNISFLLTDVDAHNGPHVYVRKSHRNKPQALRRDGRYSDEEIASHYPDQIVEIGGPRGTIFVTDNRAFHKGKNLQKGTRLLFQMVFADSSFGQNYDPVRVPANLNPDLRDAIDRFPFTYSRFTPGG
jgi:hypothetical protein